MNNGQLDDLKQFIDFRISQSEVRFDDKLEALRSEMADGFAGVGEAFDELHSQLSERDKEIDRRFSSLEQKTA